MTRKPSQGLFITGTNTEVGKTYVTSLIARSLVACGRRVGVYKPVASGCHRQQSTLVSDDALSLWHAAGEPGDLAAVCPQLFSAPLAPHLAARAEDKEIDSQLLFQGIDYWSDRCDIVLVEGVGGLMSPLSDDLYVADLALEFGYPLIVVAANSLGVISQTLQTLITAATFREGLEVAGIVLNQVHSDDDMSRQTNYQQLKEHCRPPVLASLSWQAEAFSTEIDWFALAGVRPAE